MIEGIVIIVSMFIIAPALLIAQEEVRYYLYRRQQAKQTYRKERNVYRIR